jgi:hypothetical protein
MRRGVSLLLAALFVAALPLTGRAQTAAAPATAQPSAAQPAPAAVPAPAAAPKVTITPYGFILTQAFFNDGPFSAKDTGFQALANHDGGAFILSARGSRFGFKIGVPDDPWTGAKLAAVIEADFKAGSLPTAAQVSPTCTTTASTTTPVAYTTTCSASSSLTAPSTSWYNGLLRLRHAYMTATWGGPDAKVELLAGQSWGLIAPLFANSVAWGYDPLFWQAGNLWRRSPQFRLSFETGNQIGVNVAAAALSPADAQVSNATATSAAPVPGYALDYGAGNRSRVPNFEGRAAVWAKQGSKKVAELGVSYHYDKRRYSATNSLVSADSTGQVIAADLVMNLPFITIQGEGFFNDGAGDTMNAIAPAVVVSGGASGAVPVVRTIQSRGGWAQAVIKPIPEIEIPVGYGVEQVAYKNVGLAATTRTSNHEFAAGAIFNANHPWKFAFEWVHTLSKYELATTAFARQAEANQFAVSSKLDF